MPTITTRWAVSEPEAHRLADLNSNDELLAVVAEPEGDDEPKLVVVLRDGRVTDRYADGTTGVPEATRKEIAQQGTFLHPIAPDALTAALDTAIDVEDTASWAEVVTDERGAFVSVAT